MRRQTRDVKRVQPTLSALHTPAARGGLTLLEVVLAVGIFAMSFAAIFRLMSTGSHASMTARLQTEAMLRCESRIAEIVAGTDLSVAAAETVFDDDAAWSWQAVVVPQPELRSGDRETVFANGIAELSVTVRRRNPVDDVIAVATLSRLVVAQATSGDRR